MAKGGRKAGGVLAIIGGGMVILAGFLAFLLILQSELFLITGGVTTVCGVLGLIGGILLLKDKTAGGVLALIAGVIILIGSFFILDSGSYWSGIWEIFWFAKVATYLVFFADPVLLIVGGIVGLAVGSEL